MPKSEIIKNRILQEADKDYKKFSSSLIPNINNILGVRIPVLRRLAKELFKEYGETCLETCEKEYMEEVMIR